MRHAVAILNAPQLSTPGVDTFDAGVAGAAKRVYTDDAALLDVMARRRGELWGGKEALGAAAVASGHACLSSQPARRFPSVAACGNNGAKVWEASVCRVSPDATFIFCSSLFVERVFFMKFVFCVLCIYYAGTSHALTRGHYAGGRLSQDSGPATLRQASPSQGGRTEVFAPLGRRAGHVPAVAAAGSQRAQAG